MKPYDQHEKTDSIVSEPVAVYGEMQQSAAIQIEPSSEIPEGYLTLSQFGDLFHQKLDECYAELRSDSCS